MSDLQLWDFATAGFLHLAMGVGLLVANALMDKTAFSPPEVTRVTALSAPLKQMTEMPNRATRKAKKPKPKTETKPDKKPDPKPEPKTKPEPKPDAMPAPVASAKETPKEVPPEDNSDEREALLRELEMQDLLEDFAAPEGEEDIAPTSADGVDNPMQASIGSGATDPELATYIQRCRTALLSNWTPLPAILEAHPEYAVVLQVKVDSSGKMSAPQIIQGSGDSSFDQAALLAVHKTGSLPPPPEKWKASAESGVQITLAASDK